MTWAPPTPSRIVISQGAKPQRRRTAVAARRSASGRRRVRALPPGVRPIGPPRGTQSSSAAEQFLRIKVEDLREATGWEKPVYVKLGTTRVEHDVRLAVSGRARTSSS